MEMQLPYETVNLLPARMAGIVPIKLKNATYAKTKLVPFPGDNNSRNNTTTNKLMPIFVPRRLERREKSLMKVFKSCLNVSYIKLYCYLRIFRSAPPNVYGHTKALAAL